jgi:hypothetical protein
LVFRIFARVSNVEVAPLHVGGHHLGGVRLGRLTNISPSRIKVTNMASRKKMALRPSKSSGIVRSFL